MADTETRLNILKALYFARNRGDLYAGGEMVKEEVKAKDLDFKLAVEYLIEKRLVERDPLKSNFLSITARGVDFVEGPNIFSMMSSDILSAALIMDPGFRDEIRDVVEEILRERE